MKQNLRIRQHYGRVQFVLDGKLVCEMPWQSALETCGALRSAAKTAEEWDKAERVAADQALLIRAGAPIGLTNHPAIRDEAAKVAAWDRDLRRYLPGGVKSQEHVGTPTVTRHEK